MFLQRSHKAEYKILNKITTILEGCIGLLQGLTGPFTGPIKESVIPIYKGGGNGCRA